MRTQSISLLFFVIGYVLCQPPMGGQQQPQDPPFLQGASDSVKSSFRALFENTDNFTEKQMDDKVNAWIAQQSTTIQNQYKQFQQQMKQMKQQAQQAHQRAVQTLSSGAKQADADLIKITDNANLTPAQKNQQISDYISKLQKSNPSVAAEIQQLMQQAPQMMF
ncbi:unnamed protein product, partial [Mesorhabditis belari]|uniref:SXP/RAL-2 family protein Ani s 5-like cation-binding domain-containing protein n=1 Tax=Mesorhabditis belari TaxID=2138241 RepID=A0AAF3EWZ7_9BILA